MKKNYIIKFIIIFLLLIIQKIFIFSNEISYPFIYIPGMFDNGDLLTKDSLLVKNLNKQSIPENIKIFNFRVKSAYTPMFNNLGKYLKLGKNDGAVDFKDTELNHIPNIDKILLKNFTVEKANHIPFPYIKPVFELRDTITDNYAFLKILLNNNQSKEDGINILLALFKAIMNEFGLDLEYLLKNENYSIIDYFAENPIDFWD